MYRRLLTENSVLWLDGAVSHSLLNKFGVVRSLIEVRPSSKIGHQVGAKGCYQSTIAFKLQSIIKALFIYRKISVCLLDWPDGIAHHSKTDYM